MNRIYRSRRLPALFGILIALPLLALGTLGIYYAGLESVWFFGWFVLISFVVGILGSLAILSIRVDMDQRGITKSNMYRVDVAFSWDEVIFWNVAPVKIPDDMAEDTFTHRKIAFYLHARTEPVIIYDRDVWRPGFEQFLTDIRRILANKEKAG